MEHTDILLALEEEVTFEIMGRLSIPCGMGDSIAVETGNIRLFHETCYGRCIPKSDFS